MSKKEITCSGDIARSYAQSWKLKFFALLCLGYGAYDFRMILEDLQNDGFKSDYWYAYLLRTVAIAFMCVGIFSSFNAKKPVEKLVSDLRALQIGFLIMAVSEILIIFLLHLPIILSPTFNLHSGEGQIGLYEFLKYVGVMLACIFAVFIVQNVINAMKGDPAGKFAAIVCGICSLFAVACVLMVDYSFYKEITMYVPFDSIFEPFKMLFKGSKDALKLQFVAIVMLGAAFCSFSWLFTGKKVNDYIFFNEDEASSDEENIEAAENTENVENESSELSEAEKSAEEDAQN